MNDRMTQKGANEAAEGETYQSEVRLSDQIDIETIPDAVPKPVFTKVNCLSDVDENLVVTNLETTGLIQRGLMPHITQIAAQVMKTDARFSCFVSPKVPISVNAKQVTGISWDGEHMTVHIKPVETVCNFCKCLLHPSCSENRSKQKQICYWIFAMACHEWTTSGN
ncbi:uncharacterized protein LOC111101394 [Crassostrea virginica]